MNLSLVPKFQPETEGRTLIDMRKAKLAPTEIQKPTQEEIDRIAFALAERKFANETNGGGKS